MSPELTETSKVLKKQLEGVKCLSFLNRRSSKGTPVILKICPSLLHGIGKGEISGVNTSFFCDDYKI